jgi:hypothetical protein
VHPSDKNDVHELYLMCDDVHALIAQMKRKKMRCTPVHEERWGSLTSVTLPGGGKLGIYQPKHASPLKPVEQAPVKSAKKKNTKKLAARKSR